MGVTIRDVAKKAGVSVSTVSKVMNHWKTISEETTKRVEAAAAELKYTPNARAVNFARGNTRNIIYLTELKKGEAYSNPHMFDIMCGVFTELARNGYTMSLMDISDEAHPKETIRDIIDQKSADGIVIHGSVINQATADLIIDRSFPHLVIGHPDFDNRLCWVDTNHELAGEHAGEYILKHDAFPTFFIGGRKNEFISHEREKGFRSFLLRHKHRVTSDHVVYTSSTWQEGYEAAMKILSYDSSDASAAGGNQIPGSIVCENNTIAVGVSRAIKELGLSVPEDVAFLTFDVYPYSTILDPKPEVVEINVYDMGVQAGSMICRKIDNPGLMIQSYITLPEME